MERLKESADSEAGMRGYSLSPDLQASRAGRLSATAFVIAPGPGRPGSPVQAEIGFQTSGRQMRFAECHELGLVLDGVGLPYRRSRHFGNLGRGLVVEGVLIPVSAAELNRIGRSSRIEYLLCGKRGTLEQTDLALLQMMIRRWRRGRAGGVDRTRGR